MNDDAAHRPWPEPKAANWAMAVLMLAYVFSFVDRTIIGMLVGPIKASLHISDTELSLLSGFAFALFYTGLGLPVGALVDRGRRVPLAAAGVAVWSLMTAACGLATSYTGLLIARIGVGAGEATLSPVAYSLTPDLYPPGRRGRALGFYGAAPCVGSSLAFIMGGLIVAATSDSHWVLPVVGQIDGWRAAFLVVGLPGLIAALLVMTIREPERREVSTQDRGEFLASARRHGWAYATVICGFSMINLPLQAFVAWGPAFFDRVHHFSRPQAGLVMGLSFLIPGVASLLIGGALVDRWLKAGDRDAALRVALLGLVAGLPVVALFGLDLSATGHAAAMAAFVFCSMMTVGAAPVALAQISTNRLRGRLGAVYMVGLNMIGIGSGPTVVAVLSDHLFRSEAALGKAAALAGVVTCVLGVVMVMAGRGAYLRAAEETAASAAA